MSDEENFSDDEPQLPGFDDNGVRINYDTNIVPAEELGSASPDEGSDENQPSDDEPDPFDSDEELIPVPDDEELEDLDKDTRDLITPEMGRYDDVPVTRKKKIIWQDPNERPRRAKKRKGVTKEQRNKEQLEKQRRIAKEKSTEDTEILNSVTEEVTSHKYDLWGNLRSYLTSHGAGDIFQKWTSDLITPKESNCMIKSSTECSSTERLDLLRQRIDADEIPEAREISPMEVVEVLHRITTKFHANVGIRLSVMTYADIQVRDIKDEEIKELSKDYIRNVTNVIKWVFSDDVFENVFPESLLEEKVIKKMEQRYPDPSKRATFSMLLRKNALKERIFEVINIDVEDIINGSKNMKATEQLADEAQHRYRSTPTGSQAMMENRYINEAKATHKLMFEMINLRETFATFLRSEDETRCSDLDAISDTMYLANQKRITGLFRNYYKENLGGMSALIQSETPTSPFAQSTYELDPKNKDEVDLCHLLMWPDRMAATLNPATGVLIEEGNIKLYSKIISDMLDPWYLFAYRQKVFPLRNPRTGFVHYLTKTAFMYQIATTLKIAPDYTPSESEFSRPDIVAVKRSVRIPDTSHPKYNELRIKESLRQRNYFKQYHNRVARGIENPFAENDPSRPFVPGEYVYSGESFKNVVDVLHSSAYANINQIAYMAPKPSVYTVYIESFDGSRTTTDGTYVEYKVDTHPRLRDENTWTEALAGHVWYFNIVPAKDSKPNIWFKDTMYKSKDTYKEFSGYVPKVIEIDAICDLSKYESGGYNWKTFPEWMLAMFKLLATVAYNREDSSQFMVMIRLDRLKRFGHVPENLLVYFLRKFLGFGLCLHHSIAPGSGSGLYEGLDGQPYDHDYVFREIYSIYTRIVSENGRLVAQDFMETIDVTSPVLLRPLPHHKELWKMWQFYTQMINRVNFNAVPIADLNTFLKEKDDKVRKEGYKTSQMKSVRFGNATFARIYTEVFRKELAKSPIVPSDSDTVTLSIWDHYPKELAADSPSGF